MTVPYSRAWLELEWSMAFRETIEFKNEYQIGQLVFMFKESGHEWRPYWIVDKNDDKYELAAGYGDERIKGVFVDKLGIAVKNGKTYNEIH